MRAFYVLIPVAAAAVLIGAVALIVNFASIESPPPPPPPPSDGDGGESNESSIQGTRHTYPRPVFSTPSLGIAAVPTAGGGGAGGFASHGLVFDRPSLDTFAVAHQLAAAREPTATCSYDTVMPDALAATCIDRLSLRSDVSPVFARTPKTGRALLVYGAGMWSADGLSPALRWLAFMPRSSIGGGGLNVFPGPDGAWLPLTDCSGNATMVSMPGSGGEAVIWDRVGDVQLVWLSDGLRAVLLARTVAGPAFLDSPTARNTYGIAVMVYEAAHGWSAPHYIMGIAADEPWRPLSLVVRPPAGAGGLDVIFALLASDSRLALVSSIDGARTWSRPRSVPSAPRVSDRSGSTLLISVRSHPALFVMQPLVDARAVLSVSADGRGDHWAAYNLRSLSPPLQPTPVIVEQSNGTWPAVSGRAAAIFDVARQSYPELGMRIIDESAARAHPIDVTHSLFAAPRGGIHVVIDRSPYSAFKGVMYAVGPSAVGGGGDRTVLVSLRTCRAADVRPSCADTGRHPACQPAPRALSSACTRVLAPLDRAMIVRSQDDGLTWENRTLMPVDARAPQSVAHGVAVNAAGQVAVVYDALVDSNASGFWLATRVAIFEPQANGLRRVGVVELQQYDARALPWRTLAGHTAGGASITAEEGLGTDAPGSFIVAYPRAESPSSVVLPAVCSPTAVPSQDIDDSPPRSLIHLVRIRGRAAAAP